MKLYNLQSAQKSFFHNVLVAFSRQFRERAKLGAPECDVWIFSPIDSSIRMVSRSKDSRIEAGIIIDAAWHDGFSAMHTRFNVDNHTYKDVYYSDQLEFGEIARLMTEQMASMLNFKKE